MASLDFRGEQDDPISLRERREVTDELPSADSGAQVTTRKKVSCRGPSRSRRMKAAGVHLSSRMMTHSSVLTWIGGHSGAQSLRPR